MNEDKKAGLKYEIEESLEAFGMVLIERDGTWLFPFPDVDAYHIAFRPIVKGPDGSQNG